MHWNTFGVHVLRDLPFLSWIDKQSDRGGVNKVAEVEDFCSAFWGKAGTFFVMWPVWTLVRFCSCKKSSIRGGIIPVGILVSTVFGDRLGGGGGAGFPVVLPDGNASASLAFSFISGTIISRQVGKADFFLSLSSSSERADLRWISNVSSGFFNAAWNKSRPLRMSKHLWGWWNIHRLLRTNYSIWPISLLQENVLVSNETRVYMNKSIASRQCFKFVVFESKIKIRDILLEFAQSDKLVEIPDIEQCAMMK